MREILFRARRIDNGEWVEGYPVKYPSGKVAIFKECGEPPDILLRCEIDPETLCQYTGLVGKNGNRIWENNIISINTYDYNEPQEDFFGKVVYAEGWGCWCIQQPGEEKPIPLCECEGSYLTERTIEGNAFDNPEMLNDDYSAGAEDVANTAKQLISRSMNDDWKSVTHCLPEDGEEVLITYRGTDGKYYVHVDEYDHECGWATGWDDDIVAWKELPEPYRQERSDNHDGE